MRSSGGGKGVLALSLKVVGLMKTVGSGNDCGMMMGCDNEESAKIVAHLAGSYLQPR
jgi:hypothetical protein